MPTTVTNTTPASAVTNILNTASGIAIPWAQAPYQPYGGQRVADFNRTQGRTFRDIGNMREIPGRYAPAAQQAYSQLAQFNAPQIGGLAPLRSEDVRSLNMPQMNRGAYMNPYENAVVRRGIADIERGRDIALNQNAANAARSGAFGGARHAIVESETNSEAMRNIGNFSAQMRQQGYDTASNLMQQDAQRATDVRVGNAQRQQQAQGDNLNRALQRHMANQNAGLSAAGIRGSAAGGLGSLMTAHTGVANSIAGANMGVGNLMNARDQSLLTNSYNDFLTQRDWPMSTAERLAGILNSAGNTTGSTQTTNTPNPSGLSQWLGGAAGIVGLGNNLFGGGSGANSAGGLLNTIRGWFRDGGPVRINSIGAMAR